MARKDDTDRVTTKVAGFYIKSKIFLGKDKDNKPYNGTDNNPRRGSSQDRFKVYKDGITIEEALAGGLERSDIRSDYKKGFISINAVQMPETEKPPAKEKADKKADAKDGKADASKADTKPATGATAGAAGGTAQTAKPAAAAPAKTA